MAPAVADAQGVLSGGLSLWLQWEPCVWGPSVSDLPATEAAGKFPVQGHS